MACAGWQGEWRTLGIQAECGGTASEGRAASKVPFLLVHKVIEEGQFGSVEGTNVVERWRDWIGAKRRGWRLRSTFSMVSTTCLSVSFFGDQSSDPKWWGSGRSRRVPVQCEPRASQIRSDGLCRNEQNPGDMHLVQRPIRGLRPLCYLRLPIYGKRASCLTGPS